MTKVVLLLILTAVTAYMVGGINGAIITSYNIFHKDIRDYGSGNAGLTNFIRIFGLKGAVLLVFVDVVKTVASVLLGGWIMGFVGLSMVGKLFAGFCAMLGHVYPVYYHFRGGKSVLCIGTMVWCFDWRVALICWLTFLIIVIFTKYVSLGAIIGSAMVPVTLLIFGYSLTEVLLGLLCAGLVIFSHRENIKKLKNGTENKLSLGKGTGT